MSREEEETVDVTWADCRHPLPDYVDDSIKLHPEFNKRRVFTAQYKEKEVLVLQGGNGYAYTYYNGVNICKKGKIFATNYGLKRHGNYEMRNEMELPSIRRRSKGKKKMSKKDMIDGRYHLTVDIIGSRKYCDTAVAVLAEVAIDAISLEIVYVKEGDAS